MSLRDLADEVKAHPDAEHNAQSLHRANDLTYQKLPFVYKPGFVHACAVERRAYLESPSKFDLGSLQMSYLKARLDQRRNLSNLVMLCQRRSGKKDNSLRELLDPHAEFFWQLQSRSDYQNNRLRHKKEEESRQQAHFGSI